MDIAIDGRAIVPTSEPIAAPSPRPAPPAPTAPPAVASSPARPPLPTAKRSGRARWIWGGIAAVTVVALLWFVVRPRVLGPIVVGAPVVRTDLVQTLVASGRVATRFRTEVSAQITGIVTRIPVAEGQSVKAGDTLIVLDGSEARALAVQASGQAQQAAAQVRQLRELTLPSAEQTLAQAKATLLNVEATFNRNLADLGYDTPASRDEAQKNLDVARSSVRAAELSVFTNRAGGSNYTVVQAQLAQAQANLAAARTRVGYRAVLAPSAGVLIARNVEVGDVATPGAVLMQLSPVGEMDVVVQVDEKNLNLLRVGQTALVSADAYATQTFPADLFFINPGIDILRASVEVQLRVPAPPAYLRQDMTVSVDIETARHPRVLVVESADVHEIATTHPWVLVARESHARRQAVTVGLVAAGKAELLTGVAPGEVLVPMSAGAIGDGDRIRLRPAPTTAP